MKKIAYLITFLGATAVANAAPTPKGKLPTNGPPVVKTRAQCLDELGLRGKKWNLVQLQQLERCQGR
jgi:hypothetical protein